MAMYECVHQDHGKPVALKLVRTTCLKWHNCSLCDEDVLTQWSPDDTNLNIKQSINTTYAVVCEGDLFPPFHSPRIKLSQFDTHGSVHRRLLSRNTNKMQLCNRIYYSKVY